MLILKIKFYYCVNNTTLASGSDDKSIRLWDIQAGQKAKIDVHTSTVFSVCFSPDGATLASGCGGVADFSIRLWNVKTMQQKAKLDGHAHFFQSVCFSPDGATLSSGSLDCIILLRDIKTEKQKAKFVSERVQSVCFSPDGIIKQRKNLKFCLTWFNMIEILQGIFPVRIQKNEYIFLQLSKLIINQIHYHANSKIQNCLRLKLLQAVPNFFSRIKFGRLDQKLVKLFTFIPQDYCLIMKLQSEQ